MTEPSLTINLALETIKSISVPFNSTTTAEDVCITICKQLNIGTLARHLFALRVTGKQTFLSPSEFVFRDNLVLDFRIRFKVDPLKRLDKIDINAYNYYFQQARIDVLENKVPGLSYDKYKKELVGLGITDMYRVILEKGISRDIVANDYKKYLHKDVVKKHALFIKKPIIEHLRKLEERAGEINVLFVKAQYMTQLDIIAPDYLFESYKAVTDLDGQHPYSITVQVAPFDKVEPGLKYCLESKKNQWTLICSIEDLGFISIRNDGAIEISRKNGIPFYLKFQSMEKMYSFISLVDGYYRLTCKWTFNVCREVSTPSLKKLHVMKCHGPVGGEFSYAKLESKRSNRVGCFIIRESETNYNIYYIDVCMKDSLKPKTFKLEKIKEEGYIFNDDPTKYKNIHQLMQAYNDQNRTVYLQECIPPSEYDISPLLLCRSESVVGDALTDSSSLNVLIPQGPVCINYKDLQVYKGGPWCFVENDEQNYLEKEYCDIPFCDDPECSVFTKNYETYMHFTDFNGRKVFILPQWKEEGVHGGLRFSLKEWNPDLLSGFAFSFFSKSSSDEVELIIGAQMNEKVELYLNGNLLERKTFPHLISAGKWTDFWLQIRRGEIMLGFKGVPTALFEWREKNTEKPFEPMFLSYRTLYPAMPIGVFFNCGECQTENTTENNFLNFVPVGLHSLEENSHHRNLSLKLRGNGIAWVSFMWVTNNLNSYLFKLDAINGQGKEGHRGITLIYRGMWKIARGKKMEVALKLLKQQSLEKYLKDYLNLIGQWAFLKSSAVVRFFGVALAVNNISLVTEYFKLGPLDQYLRDNRSRIQKVDLIEAASNLASAVWHLKENDIVHGKIRCRKLMVNCHEENTFTVKLADPGLHTNYETSDVHWIPIECYTTLDYAKRSTAADIWALATTFYEIFTYGKVMPVTDHVQTMRWYMSGKRLPQPQGCDDEIYTLMMECWHSDPHRRKQPQEVSRDINQLLYQVYNSRKRHPYDTIRNTTSNTRSTYSLSSNTTGFLDTTEINYDELISANDPEVSSNRSESSFSNASSQHWLLSSQDLVNFDPDLGDSKDFSKLFSNSNFTISTSVDSLNSMEGIFELDDECSVVLQGRIGMGFYGDVYRGTLEYFNNPDIEPRVVAVKKLKSSAMSSSCLADFEREIKIMKGLQHDNIVEILGVLRNPEILLVMEFVQHGSLQSYLKINKETLQIPQLLKYASNIAEGMKYLGFRSIVHRDLAARNILVVDDNKVKISDFGLAQFTGTSDYYILKSPNRELPIKWYAPESLAEGKFSVKSDVWSYGVTMYEMFNYGEEPPTMVNIDKVPVGQEQQVLLSAIMSGARFPCPPNCPQGIYTRLIYPCWQADPHYRPSFEQLIKEINDLTTQY